MSIKRFLRDSSKSFWSSLMLFLVFFLVFVIAVLPDEWNGILYNITYTFLFLTTIMVVGKNRATIFILAVVAAALGWISDHFELEMIGYISNVINFGFFVYLTGYFISQIARAKVVNAQIILDSIIGYLMLGMVYAILIAFMMSINPDLYSFTHKVTPGDAVAHFQDYLYFGFVTMTTLGYGDIVPLQSLSRSLSILISVSGQLYLTIIIAVLVGKYASRKN